MKWLVALTVVLMLSTATYAQQEPPLASSERAELTLCREKIPQYLDQLESCRGASNPAYQKYLQSYWTQESAMRESTIEALSWQKFAGNVVLFLVVLLVVSGKPWPRTNFTYLIALGKK
jgi:hypothetical protein